MALVITNYLTKYNFANVPATMPSTWDLSAFIPGGVLDITHLQCRVRPAGGYWVPWGPVDAWDPITKVATFYRAITITEIEFRRKTPRFSLWMDPLDVNTSRVSEKNLQVNADQGLFVATEWAADYGINPYLIPLKDPGKGPNLLGLVQQTQNYYTNLYPNNGIMQRRWVNQKTWDFQFAGGYISRSHVKAQALTPAGWVQLTIDPTTYDPLAPSSAPFRFVGDYQLYLDLTTLAQPVTQLIIYRHTPREVNVSSIADAQRITAPGLDPSTRHAFFVAVEIGEELAKRSPTCECEAYYTSTLYPLMFEDTMSVALAALAASGTFTGITDDLMSVVVPTLQSGTLVSSVVQVSYINWRDINPDTMSVVVPTLRSGTLVSSTNPVSYINWRDINPDTMSIVVPTLQSGTLAVTIAYLVYTNGRDFNADTMSVTVPTLRSGTLV